MKRFLYILSILLVLSHTAYSQVSKVNEAAKYAQEGDFVKAQTVIDQAVLDEEAKSQARTWYIKGYIYKKLYKDKESDNPTSAYRNVAIEALEKAINIEPSGEYAKDCKAMLTFLITTRYNDGVKAMNNQNFEVAYKNYQAYVDDMQRLKLGTVEPKVIFFAGYNAFMAEEKEIALKYFKQAKELDYDNHLLYWFMARVYHSQGKIDMALDVLEEGKEKYPIEKDINDLYINYKLETGELISLENEFKKAISLDPEDLELYVTLALLYEKKAKTDNPNREEYNEKAAEVYKKILEKDPGHRRANYNLALLYYNKAVNIMNDMDDEDDDIFALNQIQDQCIALFNKSLPYFLKAHEVDPNNKEVLIGLAGVYWSLNQMEKKAEVEAKLEKLKEKEKK